MSVKVVSAIPNINRGTDYWEHKVVFYNEDTGEIYPRIYITNDKLNPNGMADLLDIKIREILIEIENNIAKPDPVIQEVDEWQ